VNKRAYSSHRKGVEGYNVLDSWDETINAINNGWAEGVDKVSKLIKSLSLEVSSGVHKEELIPAVAGIFFDIGLVCSGEPECWFAPQISEDVTSEGQKIVRLGLNATVSARFTAESMIERGAAVLVLASLLEQAGRSVAITQYCAVSKDTHSFLGSVVLKVAGQSLDIDSLAFWIACPDSFRRCWLRAMEVLPIANLLGCNDNRYGFPILDYGINKSDVYIKGNSDAQKWTRSNSIEWIYSTLHNQGVVSKKN